MNPEKQAELMIRFSGCVYKDDANSYKESDCAGAAQLILRDYANITLPDDRTEWRTYFDFLEWPVELKEFDVLMLCCHNEFEVVDHVAVHIGNNYVVHFGRYTTGAMCHRMDRFQSRIINVARYKK